MRTIIILATVASVASSTVMAQQTKVEVGTKAGATLAWNDGGDKEIFVGLPGTGSVLFLPSIYVTWFPSPAFMVEPQVLFQYNSVEDDVTLMGALQLGYQLAVSGATSFYPAVNIG